MKAKGFFVWNGDALVPSETDEKAREIKRSLKNGDRLLVSVHRPRNPEHHAMAFAVFQKIADATGRTVDTIYQEIKFLTGRYDWVRVKDENDRERAAAVLQSIAFESMDQNEFQRFWNEAWPLITERYFPGIPKKNIKEIMDIVLPREMAGVDDDADSVSGSAGA